MRLTSFKSFNENNTFSSSDDVGDFIKGNVGPGNTPIINNKKLIPFHTTTLMDDIISKCCSNKLIEDAMDFFVYLNDIIKGECKLLLIDEELLKGDDPHYPGLLGYNYDKTHTYYPGFHFGYNFDNISSFNGDVYKYKERVDKLSNISDAMESIISKSTPPLSIKHKISMSSDYWYFNGTLCDKSNPISHDLIESYLIKWLNGEYTPIKY